MGLVTLPGFPALEYGVSRVQVAATGFKASAILLDAANERAMFAGYIWAPGWVSGTKNIRNILFRTVVTTFGAGSVLELSLQDYLTTGGNPVQPDGTKDQTVTFDQAALGATGWKRSGNLSANRAVSLNDFFCVVFEITTFTAGDSIQINMWGNAHRFGLGTAFYNGTVWANDTGIVNIAFEFDDGTFGTFAGAPCMDAGITTTTSFNTGTTPDERGNEFIVDAAVRCWGFLEYQGGTQGTSSDYDMVLYDAADVVRASRSIDANTSPAVATGVDGVPTPWSGGPVVLQPGTYRIIKKPTTANSVRISSDTVDAAALWELLALTSGYFRGTTRTDAGAWTADAVRRYRLFPIFDQIDNGGDSGQTGPNFTRSLVAV